MAWAISFGKHCDIPSGIAAALTVPSKEEFPGDP
jgi:hypothetical protein